MQLADADDIITALSESCRARDDSLFEEAFATYTTDKTRAGKEKVRFRLRRIENKRRLEAKLVENNVCGAC